MILHKQNSYSLSIKCLTVLSTTTAKQQITFTSVKQTCKKLSFKIKNEKQTRFCYGTDLVISTAK